MKTLAVDSGNDLYLDPKTKSIAVNTGKQAYADIIRAAVSTVRGEIQLAVELGIPYFDTIFDSYGKVNIWKSHVEDTVKRFPFVRSISRFDASFNADTKHMNYTMDVDTDDGEVTISA